MYDFQRIRAGIERFIHLKAWMLVFAFLPAGLLNAQKYPEGCGIINAAGEPYFADNTGVTDAAPAINRALQDYPNGMAVIYLPKGTYLIKTTLQWPGYELGSYGNVILEGDGVNETVIRLCDSCPGFSDPDHPKEMIWTGTDPAQQFRNTIRDLTVHSGFGNPGAIGMRFMANNQGGVFYVHIQSGDGRGKTGLDLSYVNENGPLLVKNVSISGFETGIKTGSGQNSQTFEHIRLDNQLICGIHNEGQLISIRDLQSRGKALVIHNAGERGMVVLNHASLCGEAGSGAAIVNRGGMYLTDISGTGFSSLVENLTGTRKGSDLHRIGEWSSHADLQGEQVGSVAMEIPETPEYKSDAEDRWLLVPPSNGMDDSRIIQELIDSNASVICFPRGTYQLGERIHVRGKIKRIIGLEACLLNGRNGGFIIDEGQSPLVLIERITSGYEPGFFIIHNSRRTLVVKSACNVSVMKNEGSGDLFLENVCSNPGSHFEFHGGNVWARQLNVENSGTHILNDGADLWILGLKTERNGILVDSRNNAKTTILGFFCYTTMKPSHAMFSCRNSSFIASGSETCYYEKGYKILLKARATLFANRICTKTFPPGNGSGHLYPIIKAGSAEKAMN
ncbi:MAG: glycosyl hydrolase family 28-related protein [Bacteroidales bacterium]